MARYRLDPAHSKFTAQAFASGLLSFLGHSPTFNIGEYSGFVEFPENLIPNMRIELAVTARSLAVAGEVKPSDRQEIENRMQADVLETTAFPEIAFRAAAASTEKKAPGHYHAVLEGTLSLHGVSRPRRVDVELEVCGDGIRLRGGTTVRMSEHGINPVTALGGTIRLKDEMNLAFDLAARQEDV